MAIALVASASLSPGANGGTTAPIDTTGANLLVWSIGWWAGGGTFNAPTDSKGNTWIPLTLRGPSVHASHRFWYAKNAIVGTGHTFTADGSGTYPTQIVQAFSGADTTAPFITESGALSASTPLASGSVTPSTNGCLVVSAYACESNPSNSGESVSPAMTTIAVGSGPTGRGLTGTLIQTTAAPINPTWSWTAGASGVVAATAVFAPSGASAAPTRVQTTPRVTVATGATASMVFTTPPTVGNSVVVTAIMYSGSGALTCADNKGNTYTQQAYQAAGNMRVVVFYGAVTTTGSSFTVTITHAGGAIYFEAVSIEVTGNMTVVATSSNTGNSSTILTGATSALTAANVFVVAAHALGANQAALLVETVTPPWTQEFENLNYSATVAGEADTRSLTGVSGTTQSCSWTAGTGAQYAAVLVVFAPSGAVTVPNVVGMTQAAATSAIVSAGLIVGTVIQVSSPTVAAGLVSSQSPAAGSPVFTGSAVNFAVSVGFLSITCGTLTNTSITASRTMTFLSGTTVTINTAFTSVHTALTSVRFLWKTDVPGSTLSFKLMPAATQSVKYVDPTDLDASAGQTINLTAGSAITNSLNWVSAAIYARVTQHVVETISLPSPPAVVTQSVVEVVSLPVAPIRATQVGVEVLSLSFPPQRVTQVGVETLGYYTPTVGVRLSQVGIETLTVMPSGGIDTTVWMGTGGVIWVQ